MNGRLTLSEHQVPGASGAGWSPRSQRYSGGPGEGMLPFPQEWQHLSSWTACCGEGGGICPENVVSVQLLMRLFLKNSLTQPSWLSADKDFQGQALSWKGPSIQKNLSSCCLMLEIPLVGKPQLFISPVQINSRRQMALSGGHGSSADSSPKASAA